MRDCLRPLIKHIIGNGKSCAAWHDTWDQRGPIKSFVSNRDICRANFSLHAKVADVVYNNQWLWPEWWFVKYPILSQYSVPVIRDNVGGRMVWIDENGRESEFSVSIAWNSLRERNFKIPWVHVVWFPNAIPRHSFFLWLIMLEKLKTQDKIRFWDVSQQAKFSNVCVLCSKEEDSHKHLFFECAFSKQLWCKVRDFAKMQSVSEKWKDIVQYLQSNASRKAIWSTIGRIMLGAISYFVWHERNLRLFKKGRRIVDQIFSIIYQVIRLKIMSLKLKNTPASIEVMDLWNFGRIMVE